MNSNSVGIYTGEKLVYDILIQIFGQKPEQIHAIGHSLGAHLVGLLARTVFRLTDQKIARVTGKPEYNI